MDKTGVEARLDELAGLLGRRVAAVDRARGLAGTIERDGRYGGLTAVANLLNWSGHTTARGGPWGRMQARELLTIGDRFTIPPRRLADVARTVREIADWRGNGPMSGQMLVETITERYNRLKIGYDDNARDARLVQIELRLACNYDPEFNKAADQGDWESDI